MRIATPALIALIVAVVAHASPADTTFESTAKAFIEDYLRLNPEHATALGDHRYDHQLSDYSATANAAKAGLYRKYRAELAKIVPASHTGANRAYAWILAL